MLIDWHNSRSDWTLGNIVPDDILYYLDGPAIFTCRIGLLNYLFFKTDENIHGEHYVAAAVTDQELTALKDGKLSVRGALSQQRCWLFELDFDFNVCRYEERNEKDAKKFFPRSGLSLLNSSIVAADSLEQSDALFAFKFYGDDMSEEGMPLSTFVGLVDSVYNIAKNALVPPSLTKGRVRHLIDYPVRQPRFASLLIAIDSPVIDTAGMRETSRTKKLDPEMVEKEAFEKGQEFVEQIQKTIEMASRNKITDKFASEHISFLHSIIDILPSTDSDLSRMQFSSNSKGADLLIEADVVTGDRVREHYISAGSRKATLTGKISGLLGSSKTFRVQMSNGRELTCQLGWEQFDRLIAEEKMRIGVKVRVSGRYVERPRRDWMKIEGNVIFIS